MPSTTSSTPSSIAGSGVRGEAQRKNAASSPPSEDSAGLSTVTYDPPPASWFFSRGSKQDNKQSRDQANSENNNAPRDVDVDSSPNASNRRSTEDRNRASDHIPSSTDLGMVSDIEDDYEHEGFNFIAISNSLLMAGQSFDNIPESHKEETDSRSGTSNSDKRRGVLIVNGVASDSEDGSPTHHNTDNSVLTIPGSDALPSDIDTISHHEEDDEEEDRPEDGNSNQDSQGQDILEGPYLEDRPPLVHRFLKNLQRTRRLRLVSDASDDYAGSGVSVVRNNEEDDISMAWTVDVSFGPDNRLRKGLLKFFLGKRYLPILLVTVFLATAFGFRSFMVSQRMQREAWEQRLLREEEAMAQLLAEKESLRQEMEILVEEAAVATARAESLARAQERLILEREEAERVEKERLRLLQEEEERKKKLRENQKRRRQQPWRSESNDDEGFDWFFDDSSEECNAHKNDGSATITIADNCCFKAKADINLGSCGGETKDYFKDFWNGLWEDWDYYFDDPTSSDAIEPFSSSSSGYHQEDGNDGQEAIDSGNNYYRLASGEDQQSGQGDYNDQGHHYQYQDDTYYPPQDPLKELFSVIHSAGEAVVNKLSNLMSEEVETAEKAAQEMEDIARRTYSEASKTIGDALKTAKEDVLELEKEIEDAMKNAKEDMRELSKEALSALRTAVQKTSINPSQSTQQVTRKGLYDAANAVASLSKSWQEYAKSLSGVGEGAEE